MAYNAGASSGNLILIQSQTASAVASLAFTTGITGYDRYYIDIYNFSSTNQVAFTLVFSTNAGSSYLNTGYYQEGPCASNTGYFGNSTINGASILLTNTPNANAGFNGIGGFNLCFTSGNQQSILGNMYDGFANWAVGGLNTGTTVVNAIRFDIAAGTFSGNFKLYGVQN